MPRKKSIQQPPLDSFETIIGNGITQEILLIELRDETCPELGSGKYQSDKFEDRRDTILMELLDYDPAVQMAALKSAASFFKWFDNTKCAINLNLTEGYEEYTIKGKLYKSVRKHFLALTHIKNN
jgi:hypothetical protein